MFIFGSTLGFGAEEKPRPPTTPESAVEPEAIAAAKNEFDAVKASGNGAFQRATDVPRMSVPEWHGAAPVSNLPRPSTVAPKPEPKSATWLIDAMEKHPNGRDSRPPLDRGVRSELSGGLHDDRVESSSTPEARQAGDVKKRNDQRRAGGAEIEIVNPLARHLGDWMTPGDYTLLKPGLTQSLGSATTPRAAHIFDGVGSTSGALPSPGSEAMLGLLAPVQPNVTSIVPRENPYLATLTPVQPLIPPLVVTPKPVLQTPVPGPMVPPFSTPPSSPLSASKIPEFAKPPTDEKYFKQLKRF